MRKNGRSYLQGFRLIGLLLSCLGLSVNTLWAQATTKIIVASPAGLDATQICGFDNHPPVRMFVEDATDTCIWDIPATIAAEHEVNRLYGNTKGDTIDFIWVGEPQSGTINVQVGKEGSVKATASLEMKFVPKAAVPKNLVLDYPICQSLPTNMSIDVDEDYATKYEPGSLHLSWQHKPSGGDFAMDPPDGVDVTSDADFKYAQVYALKSYRDGEVQVTPFTCDGPNGQGYRTAGISLPLTPFIVRNLYDESNQPDEKEISPRTYMDVEDPSKEDPFQMADKLGEEEYNKTICRYYDEIWNERNRVSDGKSDRGRKPGIGDGYVYLQFGRYYNFNNPDELNGKKPEEIPEYYYRYEWTFNDGEDGKPKEFTWADDEMRRFEQNGFGRERSRIALFVHEGDGYSKNYTVKVKVYCDSCIKKGGREEDFTYEASMTFERQDSIRDFKDPDPKYQVNYHVEAQGRVCAGLPTELKIIYEDEESEYNFYNTNATLYYLQVPDGWEMDNSSAPTSNLVFRYITAQTDWNGSPGDTVPVRVYPGNQCFINLRDTTKNGDFYKVFVRNQPVKPVVYDLLDGRKIVGQYTDDRWETYKSKNQLSYETQDEYISRSPILFCNEIAGQTNQWLTANQTFGVSIPGDVIRSSSLPWGVADLDERGLNAKYRVNIGQSSDYDDSTTMTLSITPGFHEEFANNPTFRLGLFGRNECSVNGMTGDTAIFYVKIIDTLAVDTIRSQGMFYAPWDTLCEGTPIDFASQYYKQYLTLASLYAETDQTSAETDRVDYWWQFPAGWIYDPEVPNNDSTSEEPDMIVGYGSGPVKLRFGNRCGWGNPREKQVTVHPFVRVDIVGDTTPCRGDSVGYRFKKAEGADAYQWIFPADWEVISQDPSDAPNVGVCEQPSDEDSVFIGVRVGTTDGHIYVIGQKTNAPGVYDVQGNLRTTACDFRFDNYEEEHRRDSLDIRVKQFTARPIVDAVSPLKQNDTVCASKSGTFWVQKGADQDDNVFFKWFFPEDWIKDNASKDEDTVDFTTPVLEDAHKNMTVRVASSRYDCDATNQGDTLDITVWFSDTIRVKGKFLDSNNVTGRYNVDWTPCEGDTVYYTIQPQNDREVHYTLFDFQPLQPEEGIATLAEGDEDGEGDGDGEGGGEGPGGGEDPDPGEEPGGDGDEGDGDDEEKPGEIDPYLKANGWEMLSPAPYHNMVKLVVGRVPMLLRAANVSHCDTSSFKVDTIRPICRVIAPSELKADRPDDNLCTYEAVAFTFQPVEHATHYVFHYPWDENKPDTVKVAEAEADLESGRLTEDGLYKISFADTFAYAAGPVYLEAYNVCDLRKKTLRKNDTLKIVSVLTPPAVPVLAKTTYSDPFVYDAFHIIGSDTVLDTICLRKPVVLEAAPNAAEQADRPYHYAWRLAQDDESVINTGYIGTATDGSQWTLTKEAPEPKINYVWLTSRHETCERYGDTLTVALRNIDTTALADTAHIWDYLRDKAHDDNRLQTKPCAMGDDKNVAYYLDLKTLDITGESYYFRWRKDSTQAYDNIYGADGKLAGGGFVLNNLPDDEDGDGQPDWKKLDTLKMTLPSVSDTLEIQVVVINRCGEEAHLPGLKIETAEAIDNTDQYAVVMVSDYICDKEKLTFKVVSLIDKGTTDADGEPEYDTVDGIAKAGQYEWHAPWRETLDKSDTTTAFTKSYDATEYKEGSVYVVPNNGCGKGHASEAVTIIPNDILQPPMRVQPVPSVDFASGYDPAGTPIEVLLDSLCLRENFEMAVTAALTPEVDAPATEAADAPRDKLSYGWTPVYGKAEALTVYQDDSSRAYVNVPDFADSAYIIYVAARRSVCQRYGDSLRIELFPMDTIRFINDMVEDDQPYDKFTVLTRGAIRDTRPMPALDTIPASPCVESALTYAIKPDFHWSLSPDYTSTFSWNGGHTGATDENILEGTRGWLCDDVEQLPNVISVGRTGDASDILNLSIHAHNICGASVSKPLSIQPQAMIDDEVAAQKPYVVGSLCEDDTIRVAVEPVENATGYIWKASWFTKPDTTVLPEIAYANFKETKGNITVYGFNACGDGAVSEALDLQPLLYIPNQPEAKWFHDLRMDGDTVYDTLCLHGNNLLWVEAGFEDEEDDGVIYQWNLLSGYAKLNPLGEDAASVEVKPVTDNDEDLDLNMHLGDNLYLSVSARRASCNLWSEPLYIVLTMTDTVPASALGEIEWYMYDPAMSPEDKIKEDPTFPLCPGTTIRLGVSNEDAAPAYRWQLPDPTWRFEPSQRGDTTGAVVDIIVGETPGAIRVSPITDRDNRRCPYFAGTNALSTGTITLVPALPERQFADGFIEAPCAGTALTYAVMQPAPEEISEIVRYRWEFPQGWRVYDAAGNLTGGNSLETEPNIRTCLVLPDSSSGMVRAYVLSRCGNDPNHFSVSHPAERAVRPQDTARLAILAEATVCKDSTLWGVEIKALNEWTYATGYDLNVTYIGADGNVISDPEAPLVFHFPNAPDSSLVNIDWYSGDSTRVTFTPRHTGGCPNVLPVTYALKADTVPAIHGLILGPERICMGAEALFTAKPENIPDGVEVTYHWEVPENEGWAVVSGEGMAEAVIRAGWYEGVDEDTKVVRCYPRAFCGTAAPFEFTVIVNPPVPFNGSLQATRLTERAQADTCIGDHVAFDLTHNDAPTDVRYIWETPDGWNRLTPITDSSVHAEFTASKAGRDTMRVRFLDLTDPKSCGLSQPMRYAIAIRDSAPAARLKRPPYPCKTRDSVEFILVPDTEIEEVVWTWPAAYNPPKSEVSTTEGSLISNNKLTVRELVEGGGFTESFNLSVHTANVCGARDTVITVRPVDVIPDLPEDILHVGHYCLADSGYAYADKLTDYVGTGSEYRWIYDTKITWLKDSLVRENDDPSAAETVAWMWFRGAAKASDTAQIRFYIQNDCNSTDTVDVRTAPYTYTIEARPGEDTVVYGASGVALRIDTVQYGTLADYTYIWQPEDRVSLSDPAAPDAPGLTFATKGLYNPWEYFRLTATERIDMNRPFYLGHSACHAYDTVKIFVDSTFTMVMGESDTTCMDAMFEISANPYGGNSRRYHFDWYRMSEDSVYEPIADAGHAASLTMLADATTISLMVIGRDSTLVYADGEEPEEPEQPVQPEQPVDPDVPDPDVPDPDVPEVLDPDVLDYVEDIAAPTASHRFKTAEPLYVFSKVDTQYVDVHVFGLTGRLIQPGREEVHVPFGTKVRMMVEATEGSDQYAYLWEPVEMFDRYDSTMNTVTTLRLYDDCAVTMTVRDLMTGCSDTLQVSVKMSDEIGDIPNAFSPNGDGINDIFMKGFDLVIFDRFGQELFHSSNLQEGWDGTYKGKTVAPGEYLYIVTLRKGDPPVVKKGTVTVFIK